MQFRAFRMPVTLATIMKIYKNTDQECHQKRFLARVFHLKMELLMNRRPRVRKRQSRPRKYFVSYAYIERQYLFVNPLPCNYGQGEPNLHILQVSL